MTPERGEVIRYRLSRAQQVIATAARDLDGDDLISATNRLYYACFYAVTALLLPEGLSASRHASVMSLFETSTG